MSDSTAHLQGSDLQVSALRSCFLIFFLCFFQVQLLNLWYFFPFLNITTNFHRPRSGIYIYVIAKNSWNRTFEPSYWVYFFLQYGGGHGRTELWSLNLKFLPCCLVWSSVWQPHLCVKLHQFCNDQFTQLINQERWRRYGSFCHGQTNNQACFLNQLFSCHEGLRISVLDNDDLTIHPVKSP